MNREAQLQRALDELTAQYNDLRIALTSALDGKELSRDTRKRFALAREVEDLYRDREDTRLMCEKMEDWLERIANHLKGDPPSYIRWSWHDLPQLAKEIKEKAVQNESGQ